MSKAAKPLLIDQTSRTTFGSNLSFTPLPDGRIAVRRKSGTLADLRGAALRPAEPAEIVAPAKPRRAVKR